MNLHRLPARRSDDQELWTYNCLVLQNQDEAFSLAFDLLGDEQASSEVLQQVFLSGFTRRADARLPFRLRVLGWVVQACLARCPALPGPLHLEPRLARLSNDEMVVLILVERLGLSYAQAAGITGKSAADIRQIVAAARCALCKMS